MAITLNVKGTFVGSERKTGEFEPDDRPGTKMQFDYTTVSVLVDADVVKVRLPKGVHVHDFTKGEEVDLECVVPDRTRITATLAAIGLASSAA